jgi:hypothetical protein
MLPMHCVGYGKLPLQTFGESARYLLVVPADDLEPQVGVRYQAHPKCNSKLPCYVQSALVSLRMDGCSVATFGISTLLIGLSSHQRATSPGASGAGCRLSLHTRDTSGQRNAGSGWIDGSSRSQLSPRPLPYGVSSPSTDPCWSTSRCSNTLVTCLRRTTMMCKPSGSRCGRPWEFGPM